MHSLRTRILAAGMVCVLLSSIIITFAGIIGVSKTVNTESDLVIQEVTKDKKQVVDQQLSAVEQSVSILRECILEKVRANPVFWQDTMGMLGHLDEVHQIAETTVRNTPGALAVYYHMAPQISPTDGIYIIKSAQDECLDFPPSNLSTYVAGEESEAIWYSAPMEERRAVWLSPYRNEEAGKSVLSYVVPVIYEEQQIGVVGMDISFEQILIQINALSGYDGSYSFLMDEQGNIVYHPDFPDGITAQEFEQAYEKAAKVFAKGRYEKKINNYRWNGKMRKVMFRNLENGMYIGISLPLVEVRKPARVFALIALIVASVMLILAFVITDNTAAYILKPLQELTDVARKLSSGDLDVNIRCRTHDEMEVLADCIQDTADELKKYVNSLNDFARTDALTEVHNKAAYEEQIKLLTSEIERGKAQFSVIVLDVNSLKHMNDTYGHEAGDLWITGAATAIERAFGRSRVYRIGGDEFAVILEAKGRRYYDRMMTEFRKEIDRFNNRDDKIYTEKLQVACGIADFDEKIDRQYADVFRRADNEMYENKKFLKGQA